MILGNEACITKLYIRCQNEVKHLPTELKCSIIMDIPEFELADKVCENEI